MSRERRVRSPRKVVPAGAPAEADHGADTGRENEAGRGATPEEVSGRDVLEHVLGNGNPNPANERGLYLGTLLGERADGRLRVRIDDGRAVREIDALTAAPVEAKDVGCSVVVALVEGGEAVPIVLGVVRNSASPVARSAPVAVEASSEEREPTVSLDGERLVLSAEREIVLRCGKASLTLTKEGKVVLRGAYLLSRSSGVHKIKGGSVQIN